MAGSEFSLTADIYGSSGSGSQSTAGTGTHTVLDLYLDNVSGSDRRLLSLFNLDVSLGQGDFVHDDADTVGGGGGNWSATWNTLGGNAEIDSFVTLGAMSGADPFAASLDPNFDGEVAGSVSSGAGWYNNDPNNGQGNAATEERVMIGRFVILNDLVSETTVTVAGEYSYNYQAPGVYFSGMSGSFTLPAASTPAVPGPVGMLAFAALGLAGRGRRR
jgi:hypothetical protein